MLMCFHCVHHKSIFLLSELTCFLATSTDASCVCCAHAIDKGIQEFKQFLQRKQMRHFVLGRNALEKPELMPLLSFQRQIPAGAHETGLSSHPNITHLSLLFLLLLLSLSLYILHLFFFIQLHSICFMLCLGRKKSLSQHTSHTPTPACTCQSLYLANILRNLREKKKTSVPSMCRWLRLLLLKSSATF